MPTVATPAHSTIAATALQYAELGIPVYPAVPADEPDDPNPFVPCGSIDFDDFTITEHLGTTDAKTIATLWDRWPNARIAAAVGSRLLAVEIQPPSTFKLGSWGRGWEEGELIAEVRERFDFIAGPLGDAPTFLTPEGSEIRLYANPGALESWSLPRVAIRGVDDTGVLLLPESLDGWCQPLGPAALNPPPEQLVHGVARLEAACAASRHSRDEARSNDVLLNLDPDAHEAAGASFADVVTALSEGASWSSASALAKSGHLTGTKARRLEHIKESSTHPRSGVVRAAAGRGQVVYGLAEWERPAA